MIPVVKGDERAGAMFSPCELYRYRLWRVWDQTKPRANFVMLNPSTADHAKSDATVTRCRIFSEDWGYGGLEVTNIHALRATDPKELYGNPDATGPYNEQAIADTARLVLMTGGIVVCAWGAHGVLRGRGADVRTLLAGIGKIHYLRLSVKKQPGHPLYLPKDLKPVEWTNADSN